MKKGVGTKSSLAKKRGAKKADRKEKSKLRAIRGKELKMKREKEIAALQKMLNQAYIKRKQQEAAGVKFEKSFEEEIVEQAFGKPNEKIVEEITQQKE